MFREMTNSELRYIRRWSSIYEGMWNHIICAFLLYLSQGNKSYKIWFTRIPFNVNPRSVENHHVIKVEEFPWHQGETGRTRS